MKSVKLTAEIFLTIICLMVIYTFLIKPSGPDSSASNTIFSAALANTDVYSSVGNSADIDVLSQLAKQEAQRMIMTGDVKDYQKKLDQTGLLANQ